jgi:ubiquitin-protein ligase
MKDSVISVSRNAQLLFVQKEVNAINKNKILSKTTEFVIDESDISKFNVLIKPIEGLYSGLTIPFELTIPINYPAPGHPILAKCLENIYHPNIFSGGRLCLKYDGVGNFESGFKETLENLIIALNYLFVHPENYGYGKNMPEEVKEIILKNIEAYKKKSKVINHKTDSKNSSSFDNLPYYKMREIYGTNINSSLSEIKNWSTYFPPSCVSDAKKYRYYVYTFAGKKIMDLATMEEILSQVIRDPRYKFSELTNIAFTKNQRNIIDACMPTTPHDVVLYKTKRLIYPSQIEMDLVKIKTNYSLESSSKDKSNQLTTSFATGITFDDLSHINKYNFENKTKTKNLKILCNIVIKSNYAFSFVCHDSSVNVNVVVLDSTFVDSKYLMKIDQCLCGYQTVFNGCNLNLKSKCDPTKPPWFNISYSTIVMGTDVAEVFDNVAFKLNPADKQGQYLTFHRESQSTNNNNVNIINALRVLTDEELKLISKSKLSIPGSDKNQEKQDENYYDVELASKYLASSADETGLDLLGLDRLT